MILESEKQLQQRMHSRDLSHARWELDATT